MWHQRKINYKPPEKPKSLEDQISMMWDAVYNHIPCLFEKQERQSKWQELKINFILVFVALILASLATKLFGF